MVRILFEILFEILDNFYVAKLKLSHGYIFLSYTTFLKYLKYYHSSLVASLYMYMYIICDDRNALFRV